MSIYVLELSDNKYYVGKSNNVNLRFQQHLDGRGSAWTRKYRPINISTVYDTDDEDNIVLYMMEKYGIDNVRGGSFSKVELDEYDTHTIFKMLRTRNNSCFRCGSKRHYIGNCTACKRCGRTNHTEKNCYANSDIDGIDLDSTRHNEREGCNRCGRASHLEEQCYAKYDLDGFKIEEDQCIII